MTETTLVRTVNCTAHIGNIMTSITGEVPVAFWEDLSLRMSYEVPGAFYSEAAQNGHWDGRKKLFNKRWLAFPTGLFSIFRDACAEHGISYDINDTRKKPILGTPLTIKGITLRDYQLEAATTAMTKQRGMIRAATGSGKTEIIAELIARTNIKTLVLIHKQDIFHQLVERLGKRLGVPIGRLGCGVIDPQQVTVAMIQTVHRAYGGTMAGYKDIENDKTEITKPEIIQGIVEGAECVMIDECLPPLTKISLPNNKVSTIEEVCNNPFITHVLSYNEKEKIVESKKIVRKIVQEKSRDLLAIKIDVSGQIKTLVCTTNHKIWTPSGYLPAEDLCVGDTLKTLEGDNALLYQCKYCGQEESSGRALASHMFSSHKDQYDYNKLGEYPCSQCNRTFSSKNALRTHADALHNPLIQKIKKDAHERVDWAAAVKKRETSSWRQSLVEMGKRRKGENNPVFRHADTIEKIAVSSRARFASLTEEEKCAQIRRFKEAPRHRKGKPNSYEQKIIDLNIADLIYNNGKSEKIFKFNSSFTRPTGKKGWRKIPDFISKTQNKVIEIADREFWHSEKEMSEVSNRFSEIGYKCLIIYCDEISFDFEKVKKKIDTFLKNHDGKIVSIRKVKRCNRTFNLEVEDNHNYFANGTLVSNCHHVAATIFGKVLTKCEKAFYRWGFSASPFREDNADLLLDAHTGAKCVDISASELIRRGYLSKPAIFLYEFDHGRPNAFGYPHMYEQQVVNNTFRNKAVVMATLKAMAARKSVMIAVTRIDHGRMLEAMLKQVAPGKIKFASGQIDSAERKKILQDLTDKKLDVVIATTVFGEGIDCPTLDVLINAKANKSSIDSLQLIGRALRKTSTKNKVVIIDIYDDHCKYLGTHAKDRLKIYKTEPEFTIKKIKDPSNIIFP